MNETLVLVGVEPAEHGELEAALPDERRNRDAVAARIGFVHSFDGAGAGLTAAADDFAADAAAASAVEDDDTGDAVAAVFDVDGHVIAAADDKAVAADVAVVEIMSGTCSHSGLGSPTLDCYCYSIIHWTEELDS